MWMACASMPWPRCSISITRGSDGQWIPNRYGGQENIEAIHFLRQLNERVYARYPGAMTIAEESTAWPHGIAAHLRSADSGSASSGTWAGCTTRWITCRRIRSTAVITTTSSRSACIYAFTENFVLPLSHDEVVHGKGSMLGKMPGDDWQKIRQPAACCTAIMFGHPGKKLLFMGDEFGQWNEWNHDSSLDWHLAASPLHKGLQRWVRDLNTFLRGEPALYEFDSDSAGFEWVDCNDVNRSVISFLRKGREHGNKLLFVCNFTPMIHRNYRVGAPEGGFWAELLNGDAPLYGGSGQGNLGGVDANPLPVHGRPWSLSIVVPPLAIVVFKRTRG